MNGLQLSQEGRAVTGPVSEVIGQDRMLYTILGETMHLKDLKIKRSNGERGCTSLL